MSNDNSNSPPRMGIKPPENYSGPSWMARAIYTMEPIYKPETRRVKVGARSRLIKTGRNIQIGTQPHFHLLPDRMDCEGDEAETKALCAWLDKIGLPELRKRLCSEFVTPESHTIVAVDDGAYQLQASPRRSFGYLYLGAWRRPS